MPTATFPRSGRVAAVALAAAVLVGATAVASGAATRPTTVCTRFTASAGPAPTLADSALGEVSGVVASRTHPDTFWAHNDSGGDPAVYAVSATGRMLGAYEVDGATNVDWEDIAIGPGPRRGTTSLYVGDIGDNLSARDSVVVYRVAEPRRAPDGEGGTLAGTERFALRYPDGPVDAEALLVDPRRGDLYLIDKHFTDRTAAVFRAKKRQLTDGADITLQEVASFTLAKDEDAPTTVVLPGYAVTGADVSPDGAVVLVRTYRRVLAFTRPRGASLAAAFEVDPCLAPQVDERQGEAVAFTADGAGYVTIGEGPNAPVNRFGPPSTRR